MKNLVDCTTYNAIKGSLDRYRISALARFPPDFWNTYLVRVFRVQRIIRDYVNEITA